MTELLVSVRSVEEASAAVAGGADIIDVKEPSRGSLGACSTAEIEAIVNEVGGFLPVTAACGELLELDHQTLAGLPSRLCFAKIGLAKCRRDNDWLGRWENAWSSLPADVGRVAVAYADWDRCGAPAPETVITHAVNQRCRYLLIDTYFKAHRLFDLVPFDVLGSWLGEAKSLELGVVVAGSLCAEQFRTAVRQWSPDILAVRGAACVGSREGSISQTRIARLKSKLIEIDQNQAAL